MNATGIKWNKGGSMARNNGGKFSIDFSSFEEIARQLESMDLDLRDAVGEAVEMAANEVQDEVRKAVEKPNLPARGDYSSGDTAESVIDNPKVEWSGYIGEIGLGFDKSKPGAGGFLITGTPQFDPVKGLQKIFVGKSYNKKFKDKVEKALREVIRRHTS